MIFISITSIHLNFTFFFVFFLLVSIETALYNFQCNPFSTKHKRWQNNVFSNSEKMGIKTFLNLSIQFDRNIMVLIWFLGQGKSPVQQKIIFFFFNWIWWKRNSKIRIDNDKLCIAKCVGLFFVFYSGRYKMEMKQNETIKTTIHCSYEI